MRHITDTANATTTTVNGFRLPALGPSIGATAMSDTHHEPITKRYGGLLLATCKEVVDECSHVRDPTEQDIEYMVGWVMVESDWHANPEAAKDCIEELVEAGGEIDG